MRVCRSVFLAPLILVACSSPSPATESCDGGHVASPLSAAPALETLGQFPAFAHHRGVGGALVRREDGFAVARSATAPGGSWRPAGRRAWSVTLPTHARGALRLAVDSVSAEIAPLDVEDVEASAVEGAVVARTKDVDLVYVAEPNAIEEIRLLRARAEVHVARWSIKTTGSARISDDRVEIVDREGRAKLTTAPIFAVDARGLRRTPSLSLVATGPYELTLEAKLDARGLQAPIALDPLWNPAEQMAKSRVGHTATLLNDGRVLVVGGAAISGGTTDVDIAHNHAEVYDAKTDGWTATPALASARTFHAAAKLPDGKVMVFGGALREPIGLSDVRSLSSTEVYDPATNTWSVGTPLPSTRTHHGAVALSDGKILVVGGRSNFVLGAPPPPPVRFDPVAKTFTALTWPSSATVPHRPHFVPISGNRVVIAGCDPDSTTFCAPTSLFLYDEASSTFSVLGTTKRSRFNLRDFSFTAFAKLPMGDQLLALGGSDDSVERFDVAAKLSNVAFELDDPWSGMSATSLPSGDIIALGGFVSGGTGFADSVIKPFPLGYLRHAKTNSWLRATQPSTRRWFHTATLLNDGSVMIAGGRNKDGVLASVEIWRPLPLGETCTHGGDCQSGFCADGVCCDAQCGGQCQACSSTGKCLPVTGAPRGLRPLCDNPGGDICKGKVCDGKTTDACVLPGAAIKCAEAVCNASGFTGEGACDGMGVCVKPAEKACAPYGCTEIGCRTSCAAITDCANGAICVSGVCIAAAGGACSNDLTRSIGTDGKETSCQPYKCVQASGKCGESCTSSTECAGGFVCGGGKCQQPALEAAPEDSGGCSTSSARGAGSGFAILLIAMAMLRKRPKTPSSER